MSFDIPHQCVLRIEAKHGYLPGSASVIDWMRSVLAPTTRRRHGESTRSEQPEPAGQPAESTGTTGAERSWTAAARPRQSELASATGSGPEGLIPAVRNSEAATRAAFFHGTQALEIQAPDRRMRGLRKEVGRAAAHRQQIGCQATERAQRGFSRTLPCDPHEVPGTVSTQGLGRRGAGKLAARHERGDRYRG